MSKLFKLKQWLTIGETAKHLSNVLSEPVSEADVLKLGLDGHLKLSVNFVNGAPVRKGKVVSYREAKRSIKPTILGHQDVDNFFQRLPDSDSKENVQKEIKGDLIKAATAISNYFSCQLDDVLYGLELGCIDGLSIGNGLVLELDTCFVYQIKGVWDLPMIGNDRIHVEWHYNQLALGVDLDAISLDGAMVTGNGNTMYQLQESFGDHHGYNAERQLQLEKLRKLQHSKSTNRRKEKILELRKQKLKEATDKWEQWDKKDKYYPAGGLPDDSILVVRTNAITAFLNTLAVEPEQEKRKASLPTITRENDFNSCLSEVISSFIIRNDYSPNADVVLDDLKHQPPVGYIVVFKADTLSINGAKPRQLDNVKRTIKSLLDKT